MPYSITTKDGITLQNIPDDVAPDSPELVQRVQRIRSSAGGLQADVAPNGKSRTQLQAEVDAFNTPASAGERFGMGAKRVVAGAAQLFSRPLAAAATAVERYTGDTPATDHLQDLPRQNDRVVQDQLGDQEVATRGLDGMDWAGVGGEVAAMAPLAVVGGAPATLGQVARVGAAVGGASGALTATEGGDGYAGRKAVQTGIGAATGAALGPVAQKALQVLNRSGTALVNQIRSIGHRLTPQQVQVSINQTLQQAGIDTSKLSQGFMDDVTREVRSALASGGEIDSAALANRASFDQLGIQGTRGQITQDPSQYGRELFLRDAPGGEALATQYRTALQQLNERLNGMQAGAAAPIRDFEAGQQAMRVLQQSDNRGNALVNALYGVAKGTAGRDTPIDGPAFANYALQDIERDVAASALRKGAPDVVRTLNDLSTGRVELTVGRAEELIKAMNRKASGPDRELGHALGLVRARLDEAIENVAQPGTAAAQAFNTARNAAQQRFAIHDAIPALRATVKGEVAPDDFMRKFVHNAHIDDFLKLRDFVKQASPQTWQQIRGQVLGDLQNAANPAGDGSAFSQAGFGKALRTLDRSGKLEAIFSPGEIQQLKAIDRVARSVISGPPGPSRTGMGGAARASGMMARLIGSAPRLGPLQSVIQSGVARGGNVIQSNSALQQAPVARSGLSELLPAPAINRLSVLAGPAAFFPGADSTR